MKTRIMTGITLFVVLLVSGIAIAQPGRIGNRPGMGNRAVGMNNPRENTREGNFFQRIMPMMSILDLTDQQRESIRAIIEKANEDIDLLRNATEQDDPRGKFIEIFTATNLTTNTMENLLNSRIDGLKDANVIIAEALVGIHDILTDEQLARLAEFEPSTMNHAGGSAGISNHRNMNTGMHPNR